MNEAFRKAMLGRMKALRANVMALNTSADELVRCANLLDGQPVAQVLRSRAQRRRVRVLEMQGKLAALKRVYFEHDHGDA